MKVGLIKCYEVSEELLPFAGGDFLNLFKKLLPEVAEWVVFSVIDNEFPEFDQLDQCDAYICTGSSFSVYEEIDWILRLKELVQEIQKQNIPFVGMCFGHQMLAHALGGKTQKAEQGWCIGVHTQHIARHEKWMRLYQPKLEILMSCQDQVVSLPPNSVLLANAARCPVAMFKVGGNMIGIQAHPEYSKAYCQALMESRRDRIDPELIEAAMATMDRDLDDQRLAQWIWNFLKLKTGK